MLKAIIFDVGGVLFRTESQKPRRQWEERLGLQTGELAHIVFDSEQGHAAQRGEVSEEAHWQWIGDHFALSDDDLAQFRVDFFAGDKLDMDLVAYIYKLQKQLQTAIISNAFDGLRRILHDDFKIAPAFDLIVVSGEEGIMKPDAEIFERTLFRLKCKPEEAVFIDDFAHNIVGAAVVGMKGIHFRPDTNLQSLISNLQ